MVPSSSNKQLPCLGNNSRPNPKLADSLDQRPNQVSRLLGLQIYLASSSSLPWAEVSLGTRSHNSSSNNLRLGCLVSSSNSSNLQADSLVLLRLNKTNQLGACLALLRLQLQVGAFSGITTRIRLNPAPEDCLEPSLNLSSSKVEGFLGALLRPNKQEPDLAVCLARSLRLLSVRQRHLPLLSHSRTMHRAVLLLFFVVWRRFIMLGIPHRRRAGSRYVRLAKSSNHQILNHRPSITSTTWWIRNKLGCTGNLPMRRMMRFGRKPSAKIPILHGTLSSTHLHPRHLIVLQPRPGISSRIRRRQEEGRRSSRERCRSTAEARCKSCLSVLSDVAMLIPLRM